jgi:hypothetical protein
MLIICSTQAASFEETVIGISEGSRVPQWFEAQAAIDRIFR